MAITQASVLPQQYVSQLGQDYGQQLAGLTAIPLDTSQFAPQVAGQDPLQTQAASLAASGVGGYQPYLGQAATQGTQAISTLGGEEKADDVPARLSKNEFVFTADAVRAAGGGDIDAGAEVMENLMENLEAGGKVSEDSQGLEGARGMFANAQALEKRII